MFTISRALSQGKRLLARSMSSFDTLALTRPKESIVRVELNRPDKMNAMNATFFRELAECFGQLSDDPDCRVILLTGAGKHFTAGLDLVEAPSLLMEQSETDVGRRAVALKKIIQTVQSSFTAIEKCPKPVIAAIHSACIGGGVNMISACDIRYCSSDTWFQIKEIELGLAADVGVLQRLSKTVGNESLVRELAFTARKFGADEAKSLGLVSSVFDDRQTCIDAALELAETISQKSPIAIRGTKANLIYSRDHSADESLEYMALWNSAMLQSEDLMKAVQALMTKTKPVFSKL